MLKRLPLQNAPISMQFYLDEALHLLYVSDSKTLQLEMAMPQLWKFLYVYGAYLKALGLVSRPNLRLTAFDCRIFDHPGLLLGLI